VERIDATSRPGGVRVLVIEGDRTLADRITFGLRELGLEVDVAYDAGRGVERARAGAHDVVVLDRDSLGGQADRVHAELLAARPAPRLLVLTAARGSDPVATHADAHLAKPFQFSGLVARIQALAAPLPPASAVLRRGDLEVDTARGTVTRAGQPLALRRKELALLTLLLQAQGQVVSVERLLAGAWRERASPSPSTVRMTLARLRRGLGDPPLIETVAGAGYRI
jgi:DNA-binding response OmpR family regulator